MEYYIFDIQLKESALYEATDGPVRKIKISGNRSLYSFAKTITKAFGFLFDHSFGFYDSFDLMNAKKVYELFTDAGEPSSPAAKGVKKTKVSQPFANLGEKMFFLFDYGDEWRFAVELKEIRKADKGESEPVVLESTGKSPEQYPSCEE